MGGHEIRGCVTPDVGPAAPQPSPAKPSRASSSSSVVVDDEGIQGLGEAQPAAGDGGGGV